MTLSGKTILITGAARRVGRQAALALANAGANIVIHYDQSAAEALEVVSTIENMGSKAWAIQVDLEVPQNAATLIDRAWEFSPLFGLINNASIFEPLNLQNTTFEDWQRHMQINLTTPFLLSQRFAQRLQSGEHGRIVNMNDWRALRPGADHFPYTISKSGLTALTRSLAQALAPHITVNELALGAILPPSDETLNSGLLKNIPAGRWAELEEVGRTILFLMEGPEYITGETIHLDGGRHLI
jgi:pteridine reductase